VLAEAEMDARFKELVRQLAARASAEDISDEEIDREVQAVRDASRTVEHGVKLLGVAGPSYLPGRGARGPIGRPLLVVLLYNRPALFTATAPETPEPALFPEGPRE
jgi:hypothetical protein